MKFYKSVSMVFLLLWLTFVSADPVSHIILIKPGGPGSTASAKNVMEDFASTLNKISTAEIKATYFPSEKSALQFVHSNKPQIGIVSPAFYLKYRKRYNLNLQLQVREQGKLQKHYLIIVNQNSPARDLASLRGATVASNFFYEPELLSLLFFNNKDGWQKNYRVRTTRRPYTSLRRMSKGRMDAVIVDTFQWRVLRPILERAGYKMRILAKSPPVPTFPVVSFGHNGKTILRALRNLQRDSQGQQLLKTFSIDGFTFSNYNDFYRLENMWDAAK